MGNHPSRGKATTEERDLAAAERRERREARDQAENDEFTAKFAMIIGVDNWVRQQNAFVEVTNKLIQAEIVRVLEYIRLNHGTKH